MREITVFQRNVLKEARQLRESYPEKRKEDIHEIYDRFSRSKQEPFKVAAALYCYFFFRDQKELQPQELEKYIRMRIRNVVEALIEEDAPEKIQVFHDQGWFGLPEINHFIKISRERKKQQTMLYFMMTKHRKYGYQEEEWML